jgi:integrase
MKTPLSRKARKAKSGWPRQVTVGRETVTIYKRRTPSGCDGYLVANYSGDKRRLDSYANEADALEAAATLARKLSERDVIGASMTREQAVDFSSATQTLKPFNLSLPDAAATLAECLKQVGDVPTLHAALRFYLTRHKRTTPKLVAEAVTELLEVKQARGGSAAYLADLRSRLERFAGECRKQCSNVTTADIQEWLDGLKLSPQSYKNFRTVLHLLFAFCVARGYSADNPVAGAESLKINGGDVQVFTPDEIARLLKAAAPSFLPCLVLGAFAGLRSAEIERLDWSEVRLAERHVVIGAKLAKTASRRIAPLSENAVAWLSLCKKRTGKVWKGTHDEFYGAQEATAEKAGLTWKPNGLRHSAASYMFALSNDAGRIAGYLGNSAQVVHRHYRELVPPKAAQAWFNVFPEGCTPVEPLALPANAQPLTLANK